MTHLGDSLRASYGVKGIAFSIKVGAATNMLVQALGKLNDFFERKQEELYQKKKGRNE